MTEARLNAVIWQMGITLPAPAPHAPLKAKGAQSIIKAEVEVAADVEVAAGVEVEVAAGVEVEVAAGVEVAAEVAGNTTKAEIDVNNNVFSALLVKGVLSDKCVVKLLEQNPGIEQHVLPSWKWTPSYCTSHVAWVRCTQLMDQARTAKERAKAQQAQQAQQDAVQNAVNEAVANAVAEADKRATDAVTGAVGATERKLKELEERLELTNEHLRQQKELSATKDTIITALRSVVAACRHYQFEHNKDVTDLAFYRDAYNAQQCRLLKECTEGQQRKKDELSAAKDARICALQTEVDDLRAKMDHVRAMCAER